MRRCQKIMNKGFSTKQTASCPRSVKGTNVLIKLFNQYPYTGVNTGIVALWRVSELIGLAAGTVGAYVLVIKEKKVRTFIDFAFDPSCLMCLAGFLAMVVAFFGAAGSLRENIILLKIYYFLVSIFLFLEITFIVFVFIFYYVPEARTKLNLYPEDILRDAIKNYRDDEDMQNLIDAMQGTLKCCGLSNDDKGYLDWNLNIYFNCSDINVSPESCAVPFSCCKIEPGDAINLLCGGNTLTESDPSAVSERIYTQGCLKGVQTLLDGSAMIIGGVTIGVLLPQAILICLARMLKDQIKEQMSKW